MHKCVAWVVLVLMAVSGRTVATAATPEEVQNAIDKAEQYVYGQQHNGNWEISRKSKQRPAWRMMGLRGGVTVTATYALLSAGERADNPKIAAAIQYLKTTDMGGVYTIGMRCQLWRMLLPDDEIKQLLRSDGELLVKSISSDTGMYDARVDVPSSTPDHSASHFGVLGAWASAQEGMEIPTSYWQTVSDTWKAAQRKDGSWNYGKTPPDSALTLPMTAEGVATIFLAQDMLSMGTSPSCKGNEVDPAVENGLQWLGRNFSSVFESKYEYYALYSLEELGAESGRKYFGSTDWYAKAADLLVRTQKDDGSWNLNVGDTAFAILFLTHGRAPVGINKLQYFLKSDSGVTEGNWDQRPRDLVNFDRWVSKQVELDRLLNWQVVNLRARAADLHDASILYISGDQTLTLSPADKNKLKTFIEQGGMIVFNADCGSPEFSRSVKTLAAELFPKIGEFRELPMDHCILKYEQFLGSDWKDPPTILGFTNGVRELMILLPTADASRAWQAQLSTSHQSLFELGADLLLYASDKQNIRSKGDSYIVEPSSRIKATRTLKIGRIKYSGMWDPEPGGWIRLAAVMHNRDQVDLDVKPISIDANMDLTDFKVLDLTGSGHVHLTSDQWLQIHSYVESGGTLIIDAAGGSQVFNDDVRSQLQTTFFDHASDIDQPLRPGHLLYSEIGSKIDEVEYRNFARHVLQENLHMPRIRGMNFGDRVGVFYSAEDISAGLVGEPVDGIVGYSPDSATALMEHMILYAESGGRPTADAQPPTNN